MNVTWKRILVSLVLSTLPVAAAGQETQRFESFGGYSLTHDSSFFPQGSNFSGWDTSMTIFMNRWLGFTSDFSGHYASGTYPIAYVNGGPILERGSANSYTYLFGPISPIVTDVMRLSPRRSSEFTILTRAASF